MRQLTSKPANAAAPLHRVVVASSTPLARDAMTWLLARSLGVSDVVHARSPGEVLEAARDENDSMVVVHSSTPRWFPTTVFSQLTALCGPARVVIVVEKADWLALRVSRVTHGCTILDAGTESIGALCGRLRRAAKGHGYISRSIRQAALGERLNPDVLLTSTQQRVLEIIGTGVDDVEASALLGIRPTTVMTHRSHVMRKLGVRHRGELIRAAIRYGYVAIGRDGNLTPAFQGTTQL